MNAYYYKLPMRIFAAHVGAGPAMPEHRVTAWRQWYFAGCFGWWFVVRKDTPLAKPRPFNCSLAQAKANLAAGY
jgi:hypothetical protein